MSTTDPTIETCSATWDNCDGEQPHRCDRLLDHRSHHECGCGTLTPQCGAEYQPERRDPTARIVRCDLPAGHDDGHQELYTTVTWPQTAVPPTAAPATPGQDDMRRERAILRWAADRLEAEPTNYDGADERAESVEKLRRWADELSTTPPAEPEGEHHG